MFSDRETLSASNAFGHWTFNSEAGENQEALDTITNNSNEKSPWQGDK